jgi:hypothetical protein
MPEKVANKFVDILESIRKHYHTIYGGIGLFVVLAALKFTGIIDWSWWIVVLPLLLRVVIPGAFHVIVFVIEFVKSPIDLRHNATDINSIPIDIATGLPYDEWEIEGR